MLEDSRLKQERSVKHDKPLTFGEAQGCDLIAHVGENPPVRHPVELLSLPWVSEDDLSQLLSIDLLTIIC